MGRDTDRLSGQRCKTVSEFAFPGLILERGRAGSMDHPRESVR
jgi:hypothetical protein